MEPESKTCFQNHEVQFIDHKTPFDHLCEAEEGNADFIDAGQVKKIPVSALRDLLRFILPPSGKGAAVRWRSGLLRLAIVSHLASVDEDGNKTLSQIADELKITRAALSWHHTRILDELGLGESRSSKSRRARASYREAAIRSHQERGHKMTIKS